MAIGKWLLYTSSTFLSVALAAMLWFTMSDTPLSAQAKSQQTSCTSVEINSSVRQSASMNCEQYESVSTTTNSAQANSSRSTHRSFSFHYLDVLELLFGGGEQKQTSRTNSSPQSSL